MQQYSEDSSTVTKERYDISNLASAAGNTNDVNLNISSMNQYAKDTIEASQLSEYSTRQSVESGAGLSGSISESVKMSCLESRLGMKLGTSDFIQIANLNSSETFFESSEFSETRNFLSDYQSILTEQSVGTILDKTV